MAAKHLPEELVTAGQQLLDATDKLEMGAQGAMWIYSPVLEDWRYYLVTSMVDTAGRRKTYKLLIRAFDLSEFPKEMTVEDVQLGSPSDVFFQLIASGIKVTNSIARFNNCNINGVQFDGVMYRSWREIPPKSELLRIQKRFERNVRELEKT